MNDRTRWERELRKLRQMARELDAHALRFSQRVENLAPAETPLDIDAEYEELQALANQLSEQMEIVDAMRPR